VIHECDALRDRIHVFADRTDAGFALARLLAGRFGPEAAVLAIPAGGMPVAIALSAELVLPIDVAVVSKVTLPWNSEVGYGAVAFDGTVELNRDLIELLGVDEATVQRGIDATRAKVRRRVASFASKLDRPRLWDTAILVDDGIASGFTMRTAVLALRKQGVPQIVAAVPTGSIRAVRDLEPHIDELFCANLRTGKSFAVADAYETWCDVPESDAIRLLADAAQRA